jgi:transcriptional regulator with XRE-family HTH domain
MESEQIKQAQQLKSEGLSLRGIAEKLGVPLASVFRALKGKEEQSSEDTTEEARQTEDTTPASSALANGERPRSALLAERIAETRARLAVIEAELGELPQQKELLLAAEELDRQALTDLEEHGTRLAKEAELLEARIPLLENRKEGAEAEEAGRRLHEIRAEAERLQEQEAPLLAAFAEAVENLVAYAQPIADLHKQHRELCFEEVYLVDRYRLPRLGMPQLGDMPNTVEATNAVTAVLASVNNLVSHWQRKRDQWQAQRRTQPPVARSDASLFVRS